MAAAIARWVIGVPHTRRRRNNYGDAPGLESRRETPRPVPTHGLVPRSGRTSLTVSPDRARRLRLRSSPVWGRARLTPPVQRRRYGWRQSLHHHRSASNDIRRALIEAVPPGPVLRELRLVQPARYVRLPLRIQD